VGERNDHPFSWKGNNSGRAVIREGGRQVTKGKGERGKNHRSRSLKMYAIDPIQRGEAGEPMGKDLVEKKKRKGGISSREKGGGHDLLLNKLSTS